MMKLETTRFGTVEVPDDEVVTFAEGLPGFPGERRMVLLGGGHLPGMEDEAAELDHHTMYWMQDADDPDLAFLCVVPWPIYVDYDFDADVADLGITDPTELCVLVIVTARREDDMLRLTSNLRAPVIINTASRLARQVILDDTDWPITAPLAESRPVHAEPAGEAT